MGSQLTSSSQIPMSIQSSVIFLESRFIRLPKTSRPNGQHLELASVTSQLWKGSVQDFLGKERSGRITNSEQETPTPRMNGYSKASIVYGSEINVLLWIVQESWLPSCCVICSTCKRTMRLLKWPKSCWLMWDDERNRIPTWAIRAVKSGTVQAFVR